MSQNRESVQQDEFVYSLSELHKCMRCCVLDARTARPPPRCPLGACTRTSAPVIFRHGLGIIGVMTVGSHGSWS